MTIAEAILTLPERVWEPAYDAGGEVRPGASPRRGLEDDFYQPFVERNEQADLSAGWRADLYITDWRCSIIEPWLFPRCHSASN